MSDWKGRLTQYQSFMESYLAGRFLNEGEPQQKLFEAMRYSLLAGGKRLRPVLVLEADSSGFMHGICRALRRLIPAGASACLRSGDGAHLQSDSRRSSLYGQ